MVMFPYFRRSSGIGFHCFSTFNDKGRENICFIYGKVNKLLLGHYSGVDYIPSDCDLTHNNCVTGTSSRTEDSWFV